MPQLSPVMWVLSGFMVILIIITMVINYGIVWFFEMNSKFNNNNKSIVWCW